MDICHLIDPDCRACGKPVYWKKRVFYLNKLWHLDCFRCAKCKVRLNTEGEKNDIKHPKGILGEDFALRCNGCNEIFEEKKQAKSTYIKRPDLLNYFENEFIRNQRRSDREEHQLDEMTRYRLDDFEKNSQHQHYSYGNYSTEARDESKKFEHHKCHCVGHRCMRNQKTYTVIGDQNENTRRCTSNRQAKLHQPKDKRCSFADKRHLKDKYCSLTDQKQKLSDEKRPMTEKSRPFYKLFFKGARKDTNETKDKNCNCTGCKEYAKGEKLART